MSAPTKAQTKGATISATGATVAQTGSVTAGNLIEVRVCQISAANRPITSITDTLGNTYTKVETVGTYGTNRVAEIYRTISSGSGANTLTFNWSNGTDTKEVLIQEWSSTAAWPATPDDVHDTFVNGSTATDQYHTQASGVTTSANGGVSCCAWISNGSQGTVTPDSGWSQVSSLNAGVVWLEQATAGSIGPTRAHFANTTARVENACLQAFKQNAAAAGSSLLTRRRRSLAL